MFPVSREISRIVDDLATAISHDDLDLAAARLGLPLDAVLGLLETHRPAVELALAGMRIDGRLHEAKAAALLLRLLDNLSGQIDDLSPATATRVAEILLRVSGMQDKRAAALKINEPDRPKFTIIFNLGGKDAATRILTKLGDEMSHKQ